MTVIDRIELIDNVESLGALLVREAQIIEADDAAQQIQLCRRIVFQRRANLFDLVRFDGNSEIAAEIINILELIAESALQYRYDRIVGLGALSDELNKPHCFARLLFGHQQRLRRSFSDLFPQLFTDILARVRVYHRFLLDELLDHQDGLHYRFRRRRASWNVYVHRNYFVDALHYVIGAIKAA